MEYNVSDELKLSAFRFWTSGTNKGYGCDVKHGWCGSKTLIMSNLTWSSGEPSGYYTEKCVTVNFDQGTITYNDQSCVVKRNFICEVKTI